MKICALQLPTLPMSSARLDYYLQICANEGVELVCIGEYVLNNFFRDLVKMPKNLIKEQSDMRKTIMNDLCKKYDISIVAPLILQKGRGFVKVCAKFSKNQNKFYEQNFLMPYSHWDEKSFFLNSPTKVNIPTFNINRTKFAIINAYETNFDVCWQEIMKKKVDVVIVPSACTFFSETRWKELLKTRAFTNLVYILRINRVGEHKYENERWNFYGQSMLINPFSDIVNELGKDEEMLIVNIDKKEINKARSLWKFSDQLKNIGAF